MPELIILILLATPFQSHAPIKQAPEQKALDYLAGEVPRWFQQNNCWSCHNNGDAARALYAAAEFRRYRIPPDSLAATTAWLLKPGKWDDNRGNPAFSDKKLARIQFAASLTQAYDAGFVRDRAALAQAADSLLPDQDADGSWKIDAGSGPGSPVTYGTALATFMARRTLEAAVSARFAKAIARANQWFRATPPRNLLDAAATLLALPRSGPVTEYSLDLVLRAQSSDGGWGPYRLAPAEPFDTAVVILALHELKEPERTSKPIARGREFLIALQQPIGGWPATTRPPGAQSYAQHISTSGWATLALVATDPER